MAYLDREAAELEDNDVEYEAREFRAGQNSIACGNVYARLDDSTVVEERARLLTKGQHDHVPSAQKVIINSLDEWSVKNSTKNFRGTNDELAISLPAITGFKNLTWSTGTVRTYFPDKGYGFIRPDCGGLDVWFHAQDRADREYEPQAGDKIVYLTRLGVKGSLVAKQWSELKADMVSSDMKGDLRWANDQFERSVCGLSDKVKIQDEDRNSFNQPIVQNIYKTLYAQEED